MPRRILCVFLVLCTVLLGGCGQPPQAFSQQETVPMPDLNVVPYRQLRVLVQQLDDETYANLCAIYEGAMNFEQWVAFPYPMPVESFDSLLPIIRYSCPELFQLDFTQAISYRTIDDKAVQIQLPLEMTREEYEEKYAACTAVIDRLVQQTQGMTEPEKEKYVYDYITANCIYDADRENAGNPYGCLVEGYAKCDGISFSMKWAMETMGIRCLCLAGEPVDGTIGHAWNVIELDGVFYDLDVTADVVKAGQERTVLYPAYNVSQSWIRESYYVEPALSAYGALPGTDAMDMSYHALAGNFVGQGQDPQLEARFLEAYETQGSFTLQFESGEDYRGFMDSLEEAVNEIGDENQLPGWAWKYYTQESFHVLTMQVSKA